MNSFTVRRTWMVVLESSFDTMTVIWIVTTKNVNYQTHEWHKVIKMSN